jgi:hypothetical protein
MRRAVALSRQAGWIWGAWSPAAMPFRAAYAQKSRARHAKMMKETTKKTTIGIQFCSSTPNIVNF